MSLPGGYFERMYASSHDPWGFETRWYEQRKRAVTMAALPNPRYANAFEPGCSIGTLTAELAPRCERLLATDVSERALAPARERLAGSAHVRFERRSVPGEWPADECFDLVVVSELGYYLDVADLDTLSVRVAGSLTVGGVALLCHWRHPVVDYPMRGDDVHERVIAVAGLPVLVHHQEADFVLDVVGRDGDSVARRTGVLP